MKKSITLGYCCAATLAGGLLFSTSPSLRAEERAAVTNVVMVTGRSGESVPGSAAASPMGSALDPVSVANIIPAEVRFNHQLIELLRREIELSASRNNELLVRQHERQLEVLQNTNRNMLLGAGIFAFIGFAGLLSIIVYLMRSMNRMTEMTIAVTQGRPLPMSTSAPSSFLGVSDATLTSAMLPVPSSERMQNVMGRLEQRIQELEKTAQGPVVEPPSRLTSTTAPTILETVPGLNPAVQEPHSPRVTNITSLPAPTIRPIIPMAMAPTPPPAPAPVLNPVAAPKPESRHTMGDITFLFNKGQSLLQSGDATGALQCFDQVLDLQPNHGEAMVKRGMALEKLDRLENALEAYSRAVTIDPGLTVAYLYKGGVCNRLQRHREALECYEQALRAEHKTRVS